jgi:hypothetical protein
MQLEAGGGNNGMRFGGGGGMIPHMPPLHPHSHHHLPLPLDLVMNAMNGGNPVQRSGLGIMDNSSLDKMLMMRPPFFGMPTTQLNKVRFEIDFYFIYCSDLIIFIF